MKSERLYVRIDSDLKERLFDYCERGRVNVSEFMCGMIEVTLRDSVENDELPAEVVKKPPVKREKPILHSPPKVVDKRSSIWDQMDSLRKE